MMQLFLHNNIYYKKALKCIVNKQQVMVNKQRNIDFY